MESVVSGGPGLVAVGWAALGRDIDAAVWTSRDGTSWTRVPHDEAVLGGAGGRAMSSVAAGTSGLVAVGWDASGGDQDAAVWTSPDAISWSRVSHDEAVFGGAGAQWIFNLTAGGPGLVAVGWDVSGGDADAAVWTSPDGISWTRVSHDEAVFGGAGDQEMLSVIAGGPGLVAVGWDSSGGDQDAAVWTSSDGVSWSRVSQDEAVLGGESDQEMVSVIVDGPGLVAVGWDTSGGDQDAAVWSSEDGISWSRVSHDEAVLGGDGDQWMLSVTAGGPGLVAVGSDTSGEDSDAAVWVPAEED